VKLLANENFPYASVQYLEQKGFDVLAIGITNMGVSDHQVMEIAIHEARLILTFDRDYGALIYKHGYRPAMGVLYFRLDNYQPEDPGRMVVKMLSNQNFDSRKKLTVIDKDGIRQRSY
jgi:predicted nuclease of predicted toxin-antitoxin system